MPRLPKFTSSGIAETWFSLFAPSVLALGVGKQCRPSYSWCVVFSL